MTTPLPRSGTGLWLIPASATVVHLRGELDLGIASAVRDRLRRALRHSAGLLILDLSAVSFCDATGLGVLVAIQRRARSLNIALGLAAPRPHLTRVLRITGLDNSFDMYGTSPAWATRAGKVALRPPAAC
jgi:anti-sigma B factor antagonist